MAGLQYSFVHGIRFDTDVEYRVQSRWGSRYHVLPLQLPVRFASAGSGEGGLLSAVQCTALVCQKPFRQVLQWFVAQGLTDVGKLARVPCLQGDVSHVQFEAIRTSHVKIVAVLALQSIWKGDVCMVQLASRHGCRWVTGIGVEWTARDDVRDRAHGDQARALLLLDPQAMEPWACGYNARLELWHAPTRATGVVPDAHATAKLRHLSGEVWPVRIQQLIRVGLSPP